MFSLKIGSPRVTDHSTPKNTQHNEVYNAFIGVFAAFQKIQIRHVYNSIAKDTFSNQSFG
jgi:hypothetical protein